MGYSRVVRILACSALILFAAGCSQPQGGDDGGAALYRGYGRGYEVVLELAPGGENVLHTAVLPTEHHHLALEFPYKLEVTRADGVEVAARSGPRRVTEERVEFELAFEPRDARARGLAGRVTFGLCDDDETCQRTSHAFEVELPAVAKR